MKQLAAYLADERGTVTVDFVIWIPAFCAILTMAVDVSLTFFSYSRMWDVARETGRKVAIGQMTAPEATLFAEQRLPASGAYNVVVDDSGAEDIVVSITASHLSPVFGALDIFSVGDLSAVYTVHKETPPI